MATAFAIFCETDGSLTFYNRDTVPAAGGEYEGKVASAVYTGFDTAIYSYNTTPWYNNRANVTSVNFVDIISPVSTAYWFYEFNNSALTMMDLKNLDTTNVTNMSNMFYFCRGLTELDLSNFNTANVTFMRIMFMNCSALTTLDVSSFDTSKVYTTANMFTSCHSLTSLDLSSFDTSNVSDMSYMFSNCNSLTEITFPETWPTAEKCRMNQLFASCNSLTSLDLSGFDTSNVIEMQNMFQYCQALTELDLSSFDTSNVINMSYMFRNCIGLTEITFPETWSTGKNCNMSYMFYQCTGLTELDLSSFDTSNVTNMSYMFQYCNPLKELDLSSFDTSNVTNMSYMFFACRDLTELDLSSFDTTKVTNMAQMFNYCYGIKSIYASELWDVAGVTSSSSMFNNCTNLVGGKGTVFNSSYIDVTYAIVDAEGTPGYLTYKRYIPLEYLFIQNRTLFGIADKVRATTGTSGAMTPAEMQSGLDTFNTDMNIVVTQQDTKIAELQTILTTKSSVPPIDLDAEMTAQDEAITAQDNLIEQITAALEGKIVPSGGAETCVLQIQKSTWFLGTFLNLYYFDGTSYQEYFFDRYEEVQDFQVAKNSIVAINYYYDIGSFPLENIENANVIYHKGYYTDRDEFMALLYLTGDTVINLGP